MILTCGHWADLYEAGRPVGSWRWRYITPREVACKGTGAVRIDTVALDMMTEVREELGLPFLFSSIYRSPLHNARVGGAPLSRHKLSDAFDVKIFNPATDGRYHRLGGRVRAEARRLLPRWRLYEVARGVGFTGFGFYRTFLHIDRGPRREWGRNNW